MMTFRCLSTLHSVRPFADRTFVVSVHADPEADAVATTRERGSAPLKPLCSTCAARFFFPHLDAGSRGIMVLHETHL
jgi:hypothetical protein